MNVNQDENLKKAKFISDSNLDTSLRLVSVNFTRLLKDRAR